MIKIIRREQHLRDRDAMPGKRVRPRPHQPRLAHRRRGLLEHDLLGWLGQTHRSKARSDSSRRHDHQAMAPGRSGDVRREPIDAGGLERTLRSQHGGPDLDHNNRRDRDLRLVTGHGRAGCWRTGSRVDYS